MNIYLSTLSTAGKPRSDDVFWGANGSTDDWNKSLSVLGWNERWIWPSEISAQTWDLESVGNAPCLFRTNSSIASGVADIDTRPWGAGTLRLVVYYTGTVSSADAIINLQSFSNGFSSTQTGVSVSANSTIFAENHFLSMIGVSTIGALQSYETTFANPYPANADLLSVRIRSSAAADETYTGDIQVVALKYYLVSSAT